MVPALDPAAIADDVVRHPGHYGLSPIVKSLKVTSGVVHYVWRLDTADARFYLKIRGDRFSTLPIAVRPSDVSFEARATALLGGLLPHHFPRVIICREEVGLLIVSDVVGEGDSLESILGPETATSELCGDFGRTLRAVHVAAADVMESIRDPSDDDFYRLKLEHKLGFARNSTLGEIIDDLQKEPRQIIVGDPSPKNIGVHAAQTKCEFTFFDLEDVHRGNTIFDVGFVCGHILLHGHSRPTWTNAAVGAFLAGYAADMSERFVKAIALGTVLYRLTSVVPYRVHVPPDAQRQHVVSQVSDILHHNHLRLAWGTLIERLQC